MTVTVEAYHRDSVDVHILARSQADEEYARQILLVLHQSRRVVQYGIMRINFAYCPKDVRAAILAGDAPLGRILIEHNVLRRIEPQAFLLVVPGTEMMHWFGLSTPVRTYGRIATIHCNGNPAVELLEIGAPEER
jgi:chorismate-pyruvate lyase